MGSVKFDTCACTTCMLGSEYKAVCLHGMRKTAFKMKKIWSNGYNDIHDIYGENSNAIYGGMYTNS